MIEEQFISFDTAKLAKKKGFNEYSRYYYFGGPNDGGAFDSYEDAKENCLINALKLIKNGH